MMNIKKEHILKCMAFVLFLVGFYFSAGWVSASFPAFISPVPYYIWLFVWSLILVALFSYSHITRWRNPGKIRVNIIYLVFSVLLLTMYIPNTPLFAFLLLDREEIPELLFWYALIHSFEKNHEG